MARAPTRSPVVPFPTLVRSREMIPYMGGSVVAAMIGCGIKDGRYWPLHQGTTATLRFGTTIGNGTRYISLSPGPASNPALPENGIITTNHTVAAVEFDEVFTTFDSSTRSPLQPPLPATQH